MLSASAVPSIVGVGLFVKSVVVVISGVLGAVVSIVMFITLDSTRVSSVRSGAATLIA